MTFLHKLTMCITRNRTLVCVGLDSARDRLPRSVCREKYPQFVFNKAIIDRTYEYVCAYKFNSAFYEAWGESGIHELALTCEYIRTTYPHIPIIFDAKRADIGSTNVEYMQFAYGYLHVDAITLHTYLGKEALEPFLNRSDKGCIILCKTSNSGAGEFQDMLVDGKPLYEHIAQHVATQWNSKGNCMLVVGATYPQEIKTVRSIVGDMTLLVPGIGAQGGDLEKTLQGGLNREGMGLIINSSRGIIFASHGADFAQRAQHETMLLRTAIQSYIDL